MKESAALQPQSSVPMRMVAVSDGMGGIVHRMMPAPEPAPAAKGRKKPHVPDPINANPEAAAQQLRLLIERIERIESEKQELSFDLKDVYAEAKATGFDTKGLRAIIALRKLENNDRLEAEAILETYKCALGIE